MEAARSAWPALGVLLIRDGLIRPEQLDEILASQVGDDERLSNRRLGELLVDRDLVTSAEVARLVAEQHELPFVDLADPDSTVPLATGLSEELARLHSALPIRRFPDGSLLVVVADPTRPGIFDDIRRAVGAPTRFALAAPDAIDAAIDAAEADNRFRPPETLDLPPLLLAEPAEPPLTPDFVTVSSAEAAWPVLGSLLLRDGLITEDELEAALAQQRLSNTRRLGEILVQRGTLTERELAQTLAEQHELPFVDLREQEIDHAAAAMLPERLARELGALPVSILPDESLLVAVTDPTRALQSEGLQSALDGPVQLAVAVPDELELAIAAIRVQPAPSVEPATVVEAPAEPPVAPPSESPPALVAVEQEPEPDSRWITDEIESAVALGATAVQVVSGADGIVVRARIDDELREIATVASGDPEALMSALAELATLDRPRFTVGERTVELRPVVLPTVLGERLTFRVVEDDVATSSLDELFGTAGAASLRTALERRTGLVVLCGASDAERTGALYAVLHEVAEPGRTVLSIEDPVEQLVHDVDQVEVDPRRGVTFATGLHAILRSDPDVVAVGELIEREAVRLAVRAARTGRPLVVATLSAGTAAGVAQRLVELGADRSELAQIPGCIGVAQRLRTLCIACRSSSYATPEELDLLGRPPDERGRRLLARSAGCDACSGSGYEGWARVSEVVEIGDAVHAGGRTALVDAAIELCLEGLTTSAEVARLVGTSA